MDGWMDVEWMDVEWMDVRWMDVRWMEAEWVDEWMYVGGGGRLYSLDR